MSKLWNAVIAPRVQEAILSGASVKGQPGLGQTAAKKHPSQGQQAVVKAALSILLNKAVLHGCPLPKAGMWVLLGGEEIHTLRNHTLEFVSREFFCLFVTSEIIDISQLCARTVFNCWLRFEFQSSR